MISIRIPVQHVSMTAMEEKGWELSDGGRQEREQYAVFNKRSLLAMLTARQRQVVICLDEGMKRREAALHLMVSLQAIHQIILRVRKRLRERGEVKE